MKLSHHVVATAQVGLSYFCLAGFFGMLIGEGTGHLAAGTASSLKELVMLVGFFWFQRQRDSTDPNAPKSTTETKPDAS